MRDALTAAEDLIIASTSKTNIIADKKIYLSSKIKVELSKTKQPQRYFEIET